jgi:hypothetical protein
MSQDEWRSLDERRRHHFAHRHDTDDESERRAIILPVADKRSSLMGVEANGAPG